MIPHRLIRSSLLLWAAFHLGLVSARAQVHGLYREVFTNATAARLEQSFNFPTRPLFESILTDGFETPLDIPYLAGQRVRGLLVPTSSGPYRFFLSCETSARLYLGTNETVGSRALIASVPEWSFSRDYSRSTNQSSAWINLTAGQRYYIEAVHDFAGGATTLSVAWQSQRDPVPAQGQAPISTQLLTPFRPLDGLAPSFSRNPVAQAALLGESAAFDSQAIGSIPIQYQWYHGTAPLLAETNRTLRLQATTRQAAGSYTSVAVNEFGSVTSSPAILALQTDPSIPRFSRAEVLGSVLPEAHCFAVDTQGNIEIAGEIFNEPRDPRQLAGTPLPGMGSPDAFVAKLRPNRSLLWVNMITNAAWVTVSGLVTDSQGNSYVTGSFDGPSPGVPKAGLSFGGATNLVAEAGRNSFLAKYGTGGTLAWVRQIASRPAAPGDAADVDTFGGLTLDSSESPVVCGTYRGTVSFDSTHTLSSHDGQLYVVSYDAEGHPRSSWGDGRGNGGDPSAIVVGPSGDIFMSGRVYRTLTFATNTLIDGGNGNIFLGRWTASGQLVWIQQAGGATGGSARSLVQDAEGNVYISGYLGLSAGAIAKFGGFARISQGGDIFLAKYDPSGECLWVSLLASGAALDSGMFLDRSGNIMVGGSFAGSISAQGMTLATYYPALNSYQPCIFQFSPSGTLLWAQQAAGAGSAYLSGLAATPGGGIALAGALAPDTNPTDFGTYRLTNSLHSYAFYLAQLNPDLDGPPTIIAQPKDAASVDGAPVFFAVAARGSPEITYQWFLRGQPIPGATSSVMLLNAPGRADQGAYRAVASNAFGKAVSTPALLSVNYRVTATPNGFGSVILTPSDGIVSAGESIGISAVPAPGGGFIRWSGDATGNQNPLSLIVDRPLSITAQFAFRQLRTEVVGPGSVSADPARNYYDTGQQVSLLATPARYYTFSSWRDGSTQNPRTITIGAENVFSAVFVPLLPLETLHIGLTTRTAPVGVPQVLVNGAWILAGRVTLRGPARIELRTSFPGGELFFSLDGSDPTPQEFYYQAPFTLTSSRVIRPLALDESLTLSREADAVEVVILPTVTLDTTTSGGGTVTTLPAGSSFAPDTKVQAHATPLPGYAFLGWTGDLGGTNPIETITLSGDRRIQAIFGTLLSVSTVGRGRIVVEPSEPWLPYGSEVTLYPVPDPGSAFATWNRSLVGTNQPGRLTITNPNPAVAALFLNLSANEVTLSAVCEGAGQVEVHPGANRYRPGATVQLRAIAGPGEEFLGWSGAETGQANPLQVTLSTNAMFVARFTQNPVIRHSFLERDGESQSLRLEIGGAMGGTFEIQGKDSLETSWRSLFLGTNHLGVEQFIDLIPPGTPQRLYRAIPPAR